jgi:hypothetical protein
MIRDSIMDNAQRAIIRDVRAHLNRSARHRSECSDLIVALSLRELRANAVRSNGGWAVSDVEFKRLWSLIGERHPGWLREPPKAMPDTSSSGPMLSNEMGSVRWVKDAFDAKSPRERMDLSNRFMIELDEKANAYVGHPKH